MRTTNKKSRPRGGLTYEAAGVPHLKGDPKYNGEIKNWIKSTKIHGVMGSATGFAAMFDLKSRGIKDPVMVTSTDGVGTKLELAALQRKHDTIGIDLVAMCVNDILAVGAAPVVFLDYFATGKFNPATTREVLRGVVDGCKQAGCALVGGETAIMPGFYQVSGDHSQYDVAGFSVGLVSKSRIIDGSKIKKGHVVLGIASSGVHSNGFSMVRKLFSKKELSGKIGKTLLTPTRIYVKPVLRVMQSVSVLGIANITGGGLVDNLPRILPAGMSATIDTGAWKVPEIFSVMQKNGKVATHEMFRTFNMGIGMTLVLRPDHAGVAQRILKTYGLASWLIGKIVSGKQEIQFI